MAKPIRPSAQPTREKILQAAKEHFLKHGFDGAYIKDIAKTAQVNTNLIFHHFTNKETLWHKVKENVLAGKIADAQYDLSSAKAYFKSILDYRFKFYREHPDLVKLIQWQQLTENESALISSDAGSPNHWLAAIKEFQKKGEVRAEIEAEQIMLFIIFSTHAPFLQKVIPLTASQTKKYKEMIFTMCCDQFLVRETTYE